MPGLALVLSNRLFSRRVTVVRKNSIWPLQWRSGATAHNNGVLSMFAAAANYTEAVRVIALNASLHRVSAA